ncbi:MAG TPA: hypothetical protein VM487_02820 [Phycisphaerae bacterium]|nr:hypothetical protein [Phycisphaerae bacterium]
MNALRRKLVLPSVVLASLASAVLLAQERDAGDKDSLRTADGVVGELYKLVTFEAGASPDWDKVKSLFLDQAVVVLRTGRDKQSVFSVDGFVDDFVRFSERADVKEKGFTERIVRTKSVIYGDIAHILVLYEASIPGSTRPPQHGVDSFQLVRRSGRWWIVSITNEIVTADRPVPPELKR